MRFLGTFILLLALRSWADQPPTVSYWHAWTDKAGSTHQTRCEMHQFTLKSIEPPAAPQWLDRMKADGATIVISVLPTGWTGPWHENPKPQWIIPLSGRWFVETSDGKRTEMGPGDISFGEDQNSKGHLSGNVGSEPTVLMIVQLKNPPTLNEPCHFK
jgi:quercetin dioxygenase-like cupin family protein